MSESTKTSAATAATSSASRPWGTIRRRGDRYYVRIVASGHQYERGPFSTWKTADKLRRRARTLLEGGLPIETVLSDCFGDFIGARLTFKEATPHYFAYSASRKRASSTADDRFRLGMLARAPWATKLLATLKPADFLPWIAERQASRTVKRLRPRGEGETREAFDALPDPERFVSKKLPGAATTTINKDLNLVSAVFRWAIGMGYVETNPMKRVPRLSEKGRPERVHLTAGEAAALIRVCPPVLRPFIVAAVHTGARRNELLLLRWRSVDLARRELTIESASEKAGRGRTIPMTTALQAMLKEMRATRPLPALDGSDHVFLHGDGSPLSVATIRDTFGTTVDGCDAIPKEKRDGLTLHGLRHSAGSIMVAAGIPILDVARILGHSTLSVTMRYARFAPASGRAAIDAIGAALDAESDPKPTVAEATH